ncbi:MAG: mannose-6-phosphate isomerase, class I [Saprospiraceae bacterium]|nr:mannose-6-phosphate isomerase, class I [Saprospiraceae bacterium]
MKKVYGKVKHYDWGGFTFLPNLLRLEHPDPLPHAEYWLGTHSLGPATVQGNEMHGLKEHLVEQNLPDLSFLFKVLDVRKVLSIQAHPDQHLAKQGFDQENRRGIPLDAPNRTFKDENHKPELMVALSDFWLLQGFQKDDFIKKRMLAIPELEPLVEVIDNKGLKRFCAYIFEASQEYINSILKPLGRRLIPKYEQGELRKSQIDFWSAQAFMTHNRKGFCDRGILLLYMMNLVKLSEGQAVYQYPGLLHAYLEGQNVECMAASDNVVRAGLTQKHIDIDAFMQIVDFSSGKPQIIEPLPTEQLNVYSYECPSDAFQLSRIEVGPEPILIRGSQSSIWMAIRGNGIIRSKIEYEFEQGDAFFSAPDEDIFLESRSDTLLFRATST